MVLFVERGLHFSLSIMSQKEWNAVLEKKRKNWEVIQMARRVRLEWNQNRCFFTLLDRLNQSFLVIPFLKTYSRVPKFWDYGDIYWILLKENSPPQKWPKWTRQYTCSSIYIHQTKSPSANTWSRTSWYILLLGSRPYEFKFPKFSRIHVQSFFAYRVFRLLGINTSIHSRVEVDPTAILNPNKVHLIKSKKASFF